MLPDDIPILLHQNLQMRGKKDAARRSLQKYRGVEDVEAELDVSAQQPQLDCRASHFAAHL